MRSTLVLSKTCAYRGGIYQRRVKNRTYEAYFFFAARLRGALGAAGIITTTGAAARLGSHACVVLFGLVGGPNT